MPTTIQEFLNKLASILHYLGKHHDANLLITIGLYLKEKGIETPEELVQQTHSYLGERNE